MEREVKFILTSIVAITIGTIIGLYIYYHKIEPQHLSQLHQMYQQKYQKYQANITTTNINRGITNMTTPSLKATILTSEYYDNDWHPAVGHTFYGDTEEAIIRLINAHKEADSFFKASFEGKFNWKGGTIILKNEII